MPLVNPTPVTPNVCNQLWVSSITVSNPLLSAMLRPYDPTTKSVLGNASLAKRIVADTSKDTAAAALVSAVLAKAQSVAGKAVAATVATFSEADPLGTIAMLCVFADKSSYRVADLMGLLASDSGAAAIYGDLIAYLDTK